MNKNNLRQVIQLAGLLTNDFNSYGQVELYCNILKLAKKFTNLDIHACNGTRYNDDISYQIRANKLHMEAVKLLEPYNLRYYHQSDPRGASLYIAKVELLPDNYNMLGIAIY